METGRSQFKGQGQSLQPNTDLGDIAGVGFCEHEAGSHCLCTPDQEQDGWAGQEILNGRKVRQVGHSQGRDNKKLLTLQAQRLTAGHEYLQMRAGKQKVRDLRGGGRKLLEVVEYQQRLFLTQHSLEQVGQCCCSFSLSTKA